MDFLFLIPDKILNSGIYTNSTRSTGFVFFFCRGRGGLVGCFLSMNTLILKLFNHKQSTLSFDCSE